MKYLRLALLTGLSLVSGASLAQTKTDTATVAEAKQSIRHQFELFAKALEQGDANTVANIYAPDAILLLPNMEPIKGRAALRSLFAKGNEQADTVSYKYTVDQIEIVGDWAFRWGTATETDRVKNVTTGPKVVSTHLKFVDVWKKNSDGKWYIYRDSSVIDMPPELQNLIKNCVQAKQGAKKTS